jgi:hypothetical protein
VSLLALLYTGLRLHGVGDYFTESDFYGGYAEGARLIQRGHLDPRRYGVVGPLYELVLALVGSTVGDLFLAGRLISIAAAGGTLLLWWRLIERRLGPAAAAWSLAFLAANPVFFRYGYSATTDMLATLFQAAALLALLGGTARAAALGAGLLAALAFLTRYNAVYLLPAGLLAIAVGGPPQGRRIRAATLYAAGFLIPVVPWVLHSLARGAGFSFQLHHDIAFEVYAHARGMSWNEYLSVLQPQFGSLGDVVARDPGAFATRMLFNVFDHLRQDAAILLGWPTAALCLLGLALAVRDGSWRKLAPLLLAGALLYATLVPVFYSERYSLPLAPVYLALAGAAVSSTRLRLRGRPVPQVLLAWALPLLLLTLLVADSVRYQQARLGQLPFEVVEAGRALRGIAPLHARVMARKGHIGYYSGLTVEPFPPVGTLPELADYCRARGTGFLYYSWFEAMQRPGFVYLLDTTSAVPGLTVVHATEKKPAVVYRIAPGFGRTPDWFADDTLRRVHFARALVKVGNERERWQSRAVLAADAQRRIRP